MVEKLYLGEWCAGNQGTQLSLRSRPWVTIGRGPPYLLSSPLRKSANYQILRGFLCVRDLQRSVFRHFHSPLLRERTEGRDLVVETNICLEDSEKVSIQCPSFHGHSSNLVKRRTLTRKQTSRVVPTLTLSSSSRRVPEHLLFTNYDTLCLLPYSSLHGKVFTH